MAVLIQKWQAADGSEWNTLQAAEGRERLLSEINIAMSILRIVKVERGKFYQHDLPLVRLARRRLVEIIKRERLQHWPEHQARDADEFHPNGGLGRILDDPGDPLASAWGRFGSIDFETGRQYDQPYTAMHPEEMAKAEPQ